MGDWLYGCDGLGLGEKMICRKSRREHIWTSSAITRGNRSSNLFQHSLETHADIV
jgi:hypothetical protein